MVRKISFPGEAIYISREKQEKIFNLIKEDSTLPNYIVAKGKAKKPSEFRNILFTGVTGHLGPYLLQQFSQQESLKRIFCLVRAKTIENARNRVINKLAQANILEKTNLSKIFYVLGDVTDHHLGLEENTYSYLSIIIDAVVHNAVNSNHVKSYPLPAANENPENCKLRAVNVTGVKNILMFASSGVTKPILHGSSFGCVNRRNSSDDQLVEELPEEDNFGDGITWGYVNSKFAAEKLIKTAVEERNIPVTVIRYPLICGDSNTGFTTELDNHTAVILSFWSSDIVPNNKLGFPLVPVDTCALIAKKLFLNDASSPGVYNLNPPTVATVDDMYNVGVEGRVVPLVRSSYHNYVQYILRHDDEFNRLLKVYKKIYTKEYGLKELLHSCPPARLTWYDPFKLTGTSRKLDKFVPGYQSLMPSSKKCLQNIFDFFRNSGQFPDFGINTARLNVRGRVTVKAALLGLFCFVKPDFLTSKPNNKKETNIL